MSDPATDTRFVYQDIAPPALPVSVLDNMAASIFDPNATKLGYFGMIMILLKAAFAMVYLIARERLIAAQMQVAKQKYEQAQAAKAQGQVDQAGGGLDLKRPTT